MGDEIRDIQFPGCTKMACDFTLVYKVNGVHGYPRERALVSA